MINSNIKQAIRHLKKDKINTLVQLNDTIEAPIAKGQVVGKMLAVIDGKPVASVPLIATADGEQSGFITRIWTRVVNWITSLF